MSADLDLSKLRRFKNALPTEANRGVEQSARTYRSNLVTDWLNRPGSGREYRSARGLTSGVHVASAPGEPPAPDTNTYRNSWQVEQQRPGLWAVFTPDERGPWLEFGTTRMEPRPHVTPSMREHQRRHFEIMRNVMENFIRRF